MTTQKEAHAPLGVEKRAGGRPAKPESEKLKNVPLRMTAAERQEAEKNASDAGLTLSAYLRDRTLGKPLKATVPAINREAYAELARLAGNLNQIAAHMNATGEMTDLIVLRAMIDDLNREVKILRLALLGIVEREDR